MHRHLRPKDCLLLTVYSQTAARVLTAKGDDRQLEKLGRLLIAYGRALRINTPTPKKPKQHDPGGFGVSWRDLQGDDEDDEEE